MRSELNKYLEETLEKFTKKVEWEINRLDGAIPYIPTDDVYTDQGKTDITWWTNGFWGGLLWELNALKANDKVKKAAEFAEERLDEALVQTTELHHDVGFLWHLTAVANYKQTGDEASKLRGLKAATVLAGRYNVNGEFLRCWNTDEAIGWVIVDSMMNLPLLYWASEETNDPRFKDIAIRHADTVLENIIREDGSSAHIASFDPHTGEFIEWITGQGYSPDSSWTRGQAWAVYGLALTYRYTKEERFLEAAKRCANYFIANISTTDYIPPVDFRGELSDTRTDTSAGVTAASGFLEIAKYVDEAEAQMYTEAAKKVFISTTEKYADFELEKDGIIDGGTVAYHRDVENNVPIVYSDFFYIDLLSRLLNKDLNVW